MKNYLAILFLISNCVSVFSQSDTLNQNQISIKRMGDNYEYWKSDSKFTGIIKVRLSDTYCYQEVKNGILKKDGCANVENPKAIFVWSSIAKDYDPEKALTFDKLQQQIQEISYRSKGGDSAKFDEKTLMLNGEEYNGYIMQRDTLYFYYSGKDRFFNTYFKNGNIHEYIESKDHRKHGLYIKYDELGEILEQGNYSMDKKTGEWVEKNLQTLCVNNYVYGKKTGLNHYYKNDRLILIEKYNYGDLGYYVDVEYKGDSVYHKKYSMDGKLLSTSIYRDNQLMEFITN
ncbi:toxin-antitoxin system YwqK family antitoxin [Aequorivita echinoideorum]|uniref:Antitoxin component YwqK of the YwqJK toxin-antitoxin module n=1 Tax=Aequorivita echinoideorum TaxID=1549647 RepID=A0ABS5S566_9FLAO|nr:hypothetical protein [Aequorivita echinoideorum]MBT0607560.1 hypothetical protein [Aequorivita echinoideorum]